MLNNLLKPSFKKKYNKLITSSVRKILRLHLPIELKIPDIDQTY